MSIWAGIKHALNSTLGTEDFKPLDKLLTEPNGVVAGTQVAKNILNEKIIGAYNEGTVIENTATMVASGTIKIGARISTISGGGGRAKLEVYKNSSLVYTFNISATLENVYTVDAALNVQKDDVISFRVPYGSACEEINIYATPTVTIPVVI